MKAIVQDRYGSTDVLELRDVETPVPGKGEVLIQVRAAGVDPGVWHLMTGLPYLVRPAFGLRAPKHPIRGRDLAGVVDSVGPGVTEFKPGDEVYGTCDGSFAEYACARVDRLAMIPANLRFDQAAAVPISGATALQGLRGKVHSGQRMLVVGAAGGVGTFAVQLAKAYGAEVTGVCRTAKVDLVRSIGAGEVIDYTKADFADGAQRYDLVFDTVGNRSLSDLRRALTPKGTLIAVGGEGGGRLFGAVTRVFGVTALSPFVSQKLTALMATERGADFEVLRGMIEDGLVMPAVERTYSLADAAAAIDHVHEGRALGKVVVTI
ncbi:MAG TPA: NAD(P)-dependent alcohol dehydrogenase [Actinokineospora sp.]|nr:NAD(P)-dependent alcohol dehydrogenase [Actinokineospora sp.]